MFALLPQRVQSGLQLGNPSTMHIRSLRVPQGHLVRTFV